MVIVNEAHDSPRDRAFVLKLAEAEAGLTRARAVVDRAIADHEASQRALEQLGGSQS